jgi:uncharacterized membrane protein YdjX (TVP38/TMEM64 family)
MAGSLVLLCVLLFLDGATLGVFTTPLLLLGARRLPPVPVALAGSVASAAGSIVQLWLLRLLLRSDRPWMRRFAPRREAIETALARHPTTSFAAIAIARATPLPDAPVKLVAAAIGYPLVRYGLAVLLGSLPYYAALAWLGHRFHLPVQVIVGVAAVLVLAVLADVLWRRRKRAR